MGRGILIPIDDLLSALSRAKRPMTAIEIARACGCDLPHETARRRVREAVSLARTLGHRVCADTIHGVWLEARAGEFAAYLNRRRGRAAGELAGVGRARRRADDAPMLFEVGEKDHGLDAFGR